MSFDVEPWSVTEDGLDLDGLARSESVFALSNGHIGLRGNLDEGEPFGLPGTYLNGFYETRPLPYAEAGYGYPEDGQTVVNATNGKLIRLLVDDEPFDIRYGELLKHVRTLDLRAGQLRREVHWRSPSGREVEVKTTRIVSFTQRSVAAIRYEVRPLDGKAVRVVVQSELVANEPTPDQSEDPRAASALRAPLIAEQQEVHDLRVVLVHRTNQSGLRMAAGIDHVIEDDLDADAGAEAQPDLARVWMTAEAAPDHPLCFVKFLAYGWSSRRSLPSVRDQVAAAVASAKRTGWEALERAQREYLDTFWDRADVEIEGDEALQQAVRFALFHTLQAGARAERRAIPAKGLTGPGYDGHVFWDTEMFVLPLLTFTHPESARDALRWRHATLGLARERAQQLGLEGAAFPWRTIGGEECSAYWPAGTAAFHVNADIADAVVRYLFTTARQGVRGRAGAAAAGGDRAAVALARPPRPRGGVPHRRRDRPGRVLGRRRRQHLHEPPRRAEPAHGGRGRRPQLRAGARDRRRRGGDRRLARLRRRHARPVRPAARHPPAGREVHPPRHAGPHGSRVPAAAARAVLPALPQPGLQAARPRDGDDAAWRPFHAPTKKRATSPTTSL